MTIDEVMAELRWPADAAELAEMQRARDWERWLLRGGELWVEMCCARTGKMPGAALRERFGAYRERRAAGG